MIGKRASEIKLDTTGIENIRWVWVLCEEWSRQMKRAIKDDMFEEGLDLKEYLREGDHRYACGCDKVIEDLLFKLKWLIIDFKNLSDGSKG